MSDKFLVNTTEVERQSFTDLLREVGVNPARARIAVLAGDGSDRRFLRASEQGSSFLAVLPALAGVGGRAEARSAWLIGNHLHDCGVPVPEMYGYDPATGIVICEDLGDRLLHDEVRGRVRSEEQLVKYYGPVVELLAHMQIGGGKDFQAEWCWDTRVYDRQLMLARESGYFLESCCRQLLGLRVEPVGLKAEFILLADLAADLPPRFFLHRDFQSRNIMIKDDRFRVIDFQGGRFGPLGYDLASLLLDPYVALPARVREQLLQKYIDIVAGDFDIGPAFSVEGFYLLALQRNLQILGAFAFLATVKGKVFFRDYLGPAAQSLGGLLQEPVGKQFPVLRAFAADLPGLLTGKLS